MKKEATKKAKEYLLKPINYANMKEREVITMKKKPCKIILFISIILSLFLSIGDSIFKHHVIDNLFYKETIFKWLGFTIIFSFISYFILKYLYKFLASLKYTDFKNTVLSKHFLFICFITFFLLGLPIVIIYYPGSVQWDGMRELNYFFGLSAWDNHHPVIPTILMGLSLKLGRIIGSDNIGTFIYNFIEYTFSCFTFAYLLNFMKKINTPKIILILTFIFFLNPVWYINGYTMVKDTYFYLFFILYLIQYIKYLMGDNNLIKFTLSSIPVILFRNNGIYVIVASLICLLFLKKYRKQCFILISFFCVFQFSYNFIIVKCGIAKGNVREMLSVPLQQTARYLKYYDMDREDEKFLQTLFITDLDQVVKEYNPELSDKVKNKFDVKNNKDLIKYFKIWGKYLFVHPKVYIDSFLENYYGYFYPFRKDVKDGVAWFTVIESKSVNTGYFNIHMLKRFASNRKNLEDNINKVREIPYLNMIYNTGIYTWVLLLIIGFMIYKKNYRLLLTSIPVIFMLAFCFLSPVDAYLRYMNPVIVVLPILFGVSLSKIKIQL